MSQFESGRKIFVVTSILLPEFAENCFPYPEIEGWWKTGWAKPIADIHEH
jgi:hypothetical protein